MLPRAAFLVVGRVWEHGDKSPLSDPKAAVGGAVRLLVRSPNKDIGEGVVDLCECFQRKRSFQPDNELIAHITG